MTLQSAQTICGFICLCASIKAPPPSSLFPHHHTDVAIPTTTTRFFYYYTYTHKMFFSTSNRVHVLDAPATDKKIVAAPCPTPSMSHSVSTVFQNRKASFRRSITRILHPKRSFQDDLDTPCLSTSTSISSVRSSFSFSRKSSCQQPLPAPRSSKSIELESLIVEYPSRTVRVSLTPICAA